MSAVHQWFAENPPKKPLACKLGIHRHKKITQLRGRFRTCRQAECSEHIISDPKRIECVLCGWVEASALDYEGVYVEIRKFKFVVPLDGQERA